MVFNVILLLFVNHLKDFLWFTDCLTIGIIHETMVVHMTWVWTFFNNYIYIFISGVVRRNMSIAAECWWRSCVKSWRSSLFGKTMAGLLHRNPPMTLATRCLLCATWIWCNRTPSRELNWSTSVISRLIVQLNPSFCCKVSSREGQYAADILKRYLATDGSLGVTLQLQSTWHLWKNAVFAFRWQSQTCWCISSGCWWTMGIIWIRGFTPVNWVTSTVYWCVTSNSKSSRNLFLNVNHSFICDFICLQ